MISPQTIAVSCTNDKQHEVYQAIELPIRRIIKELNDESERILQRERPTSSNVRF